MLILAGTLAACSAMPGWSKPEALYGADGTPAPTQEGTDGFPSLADVPDKVPEAMSAAQQKNVAGSLARDRRTSRSEDKALRAGTAPSTPAADVPDPSPQAMVMQPVVAPSEAAKKRVADKTSPDQKVAPEAAPASSESAEAANTEADVARPAMAAVKAEGQTKPAATPEAPVVSDAAPVSTVTSAEDDIVSPQTQQQAMTAAPPQRELAPPPAADTADAAYQKDAQDSTASVDASAGPAIPPSGIIPFPPRGGHATYAEVLAQSKHADDDTTRGENSGEGAKSDTTARAPAVNAAPTQNVEINPVGNGPGR
jgi:hypothetical protein